MRVPKGVMKIAMICNKDEDSLPATRSVNVSRLRGSTCRVESTDGRSAIRCDFEEPESELLPGFDLSEDPVKGFVQMVPAVAALDADASIGKECEYLIVDEHPPKDAVRVVVPQNVNQMWDGRVVDGKFPPLDDILINHRLVGIDADDAHLAVRVALNPKLLNDTLRAIVAATDCEGVYIDVPLRRGLVQITPLRAGQHEDLTAVLAPMHDDSDRDRIEVKLCGALRKSEPTFDDASDLAPGEIPPGAPQRVVDQMQNKADADGRPRSITGALMDNAEALANGTAPPNPAVAKELGKIGGEDFTSVTISSGGRSVTLPSKRKNKSGKKKRK